jgi:hypothetical protein
MYALITYTTLRTLQIDRADKERAERKLENKHDPNVEYIDFDEYGAGGKHGVSLPATATTGGNSSDCVIGPSSTVSEQSSTLSKASQVLAAAAAGVAAAQQQQSQPQQQQPQQQSAVSTGGVQLSSHLWSQLLD